MVDYEKTKKSQMKIDASIRWNRWLISIGAAGKLRKLAEKKKNQKFSGASFLNLHFEEFEKTF